MIVKEIFINTIKNLIKNPTEKCVLYEIVNKDGYGSIQRRENKKKKHYLTHRLSYEIANNVILEPNDIILHSCDVRNCVNPLHLNKGTHKDNVKDKVNKNRQAKGKENGRYLNGYYSKYNSTEKPKADFKELYSRSLTKEQVILLKQAIADRGNSPLIEISKQFNVQYQTVRDLNIGRIYKNVEI